MIRYLAALSVLSFGLASCDQVASRVDESTFKIFGGTLFSSPQMVSMKELHLDDGTLLGQSVIVEGSVVSVGEQATHFVLSDESARMLVVLSNIPRADQVLSDSQSKRMRVLGSVERGKKGLPFVLARVVTDANPEPKVAH